MFAGGVILYQGPPVIPLSNSRMHIKFGLTFRIGPPLFKYIEILYEKIKIYKKEKERKK